MRRVDGGSNKPENLTTTCSGHHLLLHQGKLTMTGRAPDAIVFRWTTPPPDPAGTTLVEADVRGALVTMGFKPAEAAAAITTARAHVGREPTLEQLLREALKHCTAPRT